MKESVLTGIITFNPDIGRLMKNIDSIIKQVKYILIIDNGSENCKLLYNLNSKKIKIIHNKENLGIATALFQLMEYAKNNNFKWVLTLDQDSVAEERLVDEYCKYALRSDLQDVGMFTCLIKDRNFIDDKYEKQRGEIVDVPYCITSAAFINVKKYFQTKGSDQSFFIDAVDFDICYSLREIGYRICRINFMGLYHEVGHGENRKFLWKTIVIYHQKPFRIYYFARNTIRMYRKHKSLFPWYAMIKKELALFVKIILYEDDKLTKLNQFCRGIREA